MVSLMTSVFHVAPQRQIVVLSGKDTIPFLNTKLTVNTRPWPNTGGAYAWVVDINGKIVSDGDFTVQPDGSVAAILRAPLAESLVTHLDKYVIMEDVTLAQETGFTVIECLDDTEAAVRHLQPTTLGGIACRRCPWSFAGRSGTLFVVPTDHLGDARAALVADGFAELDDAAWTTMRVVAGQPLTGAELMPAETIPLEAGEEGIIFNKGCYLGQEVIERLNSRGTPAKRVVQLSWTGAGAEPGAPLTMNDAAVGHLSTVVSTGPESWAALGWLKRKALGELESVSLGGVTPTISIVGE
jgi:aminomethyltransferase